MRLLPARRGCGSTTVPLLAARAKDHQSFLEMNRGLFIHLPLAFPAGIEPAAYLLGRGRSIHLSYGN